MSDKRGDFGVGSVDRALEGAKASQEAGDQDIDEVLASIRKLINEEPAASTGSNFAPLSERLDQSPLQRPELADPLVLTPAQKVSGVSRPEPHPERKMDTETGMYAGETVFSEAPFGDDTALRELIAEIVREELVGEFGDRLTRNVRKMIRREIAVAMRLKD